MKVIDLKYIKQYNNKFDIAGVILFNTEYGKKY